MYGKIFEKMFQIIDTGRSRENGYLKQKPDFGNGDTVKEIGLKAGVPEHRRVSE